MKTKEEIEQLAEKHYTQITLSQRTAFKLGYTQCQEDMAKELEELRESIRKNTWYDEDNFDGYED